jgi:curved DNA-binding protein CbpA
VSGNSLYENLQVHPDASPEVIKAAYKSLSRKYHPDRDKSADAARRFAEIQQAFEILSDPDRRRQYDANPTQGTSASSGSSVVFRVDGTSTFLTLAEHHRRDWKEAASCDLSNHDFSGVSFKNAILSKAKLDGSKFNGCDFRGADLTDCSAKDCQFDKADFAGAKLMRTDLSGSRIRAAKFFCVGPVSRIPPPINYEGSR